MVYGIGIASIAIASIRVICDNENQALETVTGTDHPKSVPGIFNGMENRTGELGSSTEEGPPRPESKPFKPTIKNTRMKIKSRGRLTSFHSIRAIKNRVSEMMKSGTIIR